MNRKSTPGSRLWGWLIETPLRLLSAGGILSLAGLGVSSILGQAPGAGDTWTWFNLLFGISPFFVFAVLLQRFPIWLRGTPLRYTRYGLLFFLLLGIQLIFHGSVWFFHGVGIVYLLTLLLAWYLGVTALRMVYQLSAMNRSQAEGWMLHLLYFGVAIQPFAAAGMLFEWKQAAYASLWIGFCLFLLPLVFLILTKHLLEFRQRAHLH